MTSVAVAPAAAAPAAVPRAASLIGRPSRFADRDAIPGGACLDEAIRLLHDLTHQDELVDFLTLPAYERLP